MATIDLGKIKLVWRGTYAGGTAYTVDDVVQHTDGGITSSFICTTNSTGNAPSTGGSVHGSWAYLAKGSGDATLTTQGDVLYYGGSGLARLGAGTSGQFLKTQGAGANPAWGDVVSKVLSVSNYENSTRSSLSTGSPVDLWTGTHTITKANSDLIVMVTLHFHSSSAGNMGFRFIYDGTNYDGRIGHMYVGQPHQLLSTHNFYIANASSSTGSKNWKIQYLAANGQANKPADVFNPTSSDDARTVTTVSSIIFQEIDN